MKQKKKFKTGVRISALLISLTVAAGCLAGCGVSESDYKSLERRVSALEEMYGSDSGSSKKSSSNASSDSTPNPKSTARPSSGSNNDSASGSSGFDPETVGQDIDVDEYDYVDDNGSKFAFFVFDNKSEFNVNVQVDIECKDESGKSLKTDDEMIRGLEKGKRSYVGFELDKNTDTIVRTLNYTEFSGRTSVISDVTARASKAQGGANLTIINNGSNGTDDLKYLTLFFKGSDLAGFDSGEVPNISPNTNSTIPSVFYDDYDTVDVLIAEDK